MRCKLKEIKDDRCPHCGSDVREYVSDMSHVIKDVDIHTVNDKKYGIYYEWKSVYRCPYCNKKFYEVCQH